MPLSQAQIDVSSRYGGTRYAHCWGCGADKYSVRQFANGSCVPMCEHCARFFLEGKDYATYPAAD